MATENPKVSNLKIDGVTYNLVDDEALKVIDTAMSGTSTNSVQNRVIKTYVDGTFVKKNSKNAYNFGDATNKLDSAVGNSLVTGLNNTLTSLAKRSLIGGSSNNASHMDSLMMGVFLNTTQAQSCVVGRCNNLESPGLFIIGNGDYADGTRSNAFRINQYGQVFAQGEFKSGGADYAEYFEWADANLLNEDRIGHFVTLVNGDYITIANPGDTVLGAVSGLAAVIGDSYDDQWKDMYLKDVFGRYIYEDTEIQIEVGTDKNGQPIFETVVEKRPKINPNYNPEEKYIPRSERSEWDAVGLLGKVVLIDDGTCMAGGKCTCAIGGTATASLEGFHVLRRLDESHILILLK